MRDYVHPFSGMRVLDIGCGPAEILQVLNDCNYLGIDPNERYIARARESFGERGQFMVASATFIEQLEMQFDRILLLGVLHHLEDEEARTVAQSTARLLSPGGRLVAGFDPVFHKRQHPVARLLASLDRGRFVRTSDEYQNLLSDYVQVLRADVRHDLMKVPYSHSFIVTAPRK